MLQLAAMSDPWPTEWGVRLNPHSHRDSVGVLNSLSHDGNSLFLIFWGSFMLFLILAAPFQYHRKGFNFAISQPKLIFCFFFIIIAILMSVKCISLLFWFAFSWWLIMLCIIVFIGQLYRRNFYSTPLPIFWIVLGYCCWVVGILYIFWIFGHWSLSRYIFWKYLLPFNTCLFSLLIVFFDTQKFFILILSNLFFCCCLCF